MLYSGRIRVHGCLLDFDAALQVAVPPHVHVELADALANGHGGRVELDDGVGRRVRDAHLADVGRLGVLVDGRVHLAEARRQLRLQAPRPGQAAHRADAIPHLGVRLRVVDPATAKAPLNSAVAV